MGHESTDLIVDATTTINNLIDEVDSLRVEIVRLREENESLKKIITKEFSENDEYGMEYTGIVLLKDENRKLNTAVKVLRDAVEFYANWKNYTWDYEGGCMDESKLRLLKSDHEQIEYKESDGEIYKNEVAGKKAREALASADKIMGDE